MLSLDILLLTLSIVLRVLLKAPGVILHAAITQPKKTLHTINLQLQDFVILFLNCVTPLRPIGGVIPKGLPGHGGIWPAYLAPTDQDSRSPCAGLNALANHGILPRNGRNITMTMLHKAFNESYNFSHTLCTNTTDSVTALFGREHFDLSDLNSHNIVEHDGSLLRHDAYSEPNQAPPATDLTAKFLAGATGPSSPSHPEGQITPHDLSRMLSIRRAQSKRDNPTFHLGLLHKYFASSNASLLYEVWGKGDVASMRKSLYEERLYDGFEPGMRHRYGYTMTEFHLRNAQIALGVDSSIKL